jgi:hypothetical protein
VLQWGDAVLIKDQDGTERTIQGLVLVPSADLSPDVAAAISEVSQSKDGTIKVRLHDKNSALEKIGRHLGLFLDRHEHTGANGADLLPKEPRPYRETAKDLLAILATEIGCIGDVTGHELCADVREEQARHNRNK